MTDEERWHSVVYEALKYTERYTRRDRRPWDAIVWADNKIRELEQALAASSISTAQIKLREAGKRYIGSSLNSLLQEMDEETVNVRQGR